MYVYIFLLWFVVKGKNFEIGLFKIICVINMERKKIKKKIKNLRKNKIYVYI